MSFKFNAGKHCPGEYGYQFGGGPFEEIHSDTDSEQIEQIFPTYEEAERFAFEYMKTHVIENGEGGTEWKDNDSFSWIKAREMHLLFAKRTWSYDYYWVTICEIGDKQSKEIYKFVTKYYKHNDMDPWRYLCECPREKYFNSYQEATNYAELYMGIQNYDYATNKPLKWIDIKASDEICKEGDVVCAKKTDSYNFHELYIIKLKFE